ncbi:MAG: Lrp/AsnC family transcriptional regulator [Devosiaceae bacterium]
MIDATDHKILLTLEADGRMSNTALAERVGLSQSACLRRVQGLEDAGIITGYRAVLDRTKLDGGLKVYVAVGLARHLKADQEAFERAMANAHQVRECHNVSGTIEYLLLVEVSDLAAYKHFHSDVLGMVPQVATLTSYFVMASPKNERG